MCRHLAQRGKRKHLDVDAFRIRLRRRRGDDVAVAAGVARHGGVDHRRIDERAIAAQLDHDIRAHLLLRVQDAVEHVALAATVDGDTLRFRPTRDGVVGRVIGGGDHDVIEAAGFAHALQHAAQGRPAGELHQHLAGQTRGAHARLDAGDHAAHAAPRFSACQRLSASAPR